MKKTFTLFTIIFISLFFFSATNNSNLTKLKPLERAIEINPCLEAPSKNQEGCTIEDIGCPSCLQTASNVCCQQGYEKCYYWLTEIEEN